MIPEIRKRDGASNLWQGIQRVWPKLLEGVVLDRKDGVELVSSLHSSDGRFTVKSAYDMLTEGVQTRHQSKWRKIWKWKGPERIKVFLWLLFQGKLLTNDNRKARNMVEVDGCHRCGQTNETNLHAIRDCPLVADVWLKLVSPKHWHLFFNCQMETWFERNFRNNFARNNQNIWQLWFRVTCWVLRYRRNISLFEPGKQMNDTIVEVAKRVQEFCEGPAILHAAGLVSNAREDHNFKWEALEFGWIKINSDGACEAGRRTMACGGVLRDCIGQWMGGFAFVAGEAGSLAAELSGIIHGLNLAAHLKIERVVFESDCTEALALVENGCSMVHPCWKIVAEIENLINACGVVKFTHVVREKNKVADVLARKALRRELSS